MSQFTNAWYLQMQAKFSKGKSQLDAPAQSSKLATRETGKGGLNEQIAEWCKAQWPKWVILSARTDMPSTLPLGAHDMTVFGPYPKIILCENKSSKGKRTIEQQHWARYLEILGWQVHVVQSFEQFLELTK